MVVHTVLLVHETLRQGGELLQVTGLTTLKRPCLGEGEKKHFPLPESRVSDCRYD